MTKRVLDVVASIVGIVLSAPVMIPVVFVIWLQDFHSPFYVASRIGLAGRAFRIVKLRSMVMGADGAGVYSTAEDDHRITAVGRFVRRLKLDEVPQLWNVLRGDMSLIGPRPNVENETRLYTKEERELLSVHPGVTDLSSIVFSDESAILRGSRDPNLKYNQVIRPWKSRLGLLYVNGPWTLGLDLAIVGLTVLNAVNRTRALAGVARLVERLKGSAELRVIALRSGPLPPAPPPGAAEVVRSYTVEDDPSEVPAIVGL